MRLFFLIFFLAATSFGSAITNLSGGGGGGGVDCTTGSNGQYYETNGSTCSFQTLTCASLSNSVASCSTDATNAANISSGTLPAARLPVPTATTLGGVESITSATNNWVTYIDTSGVPHQSQPAFSNLSGSVSAGQMPALTGDVTSSAGAVATTVAKIQGTSVSGTTGTTNVVFSTNPTISGSSVSIQKGNCYLTNVESDVGNSGSSVSIDMSTANVFTLTLNSATPTVTLSNYANNACPTVFIFTQDGSGSRVPSFSGPTMIWGNSGAKTFSTAGGAVDKFTCVYNGSISKLMCDLSTGYQ